MSLRRWFVLLLILSLPIRSVGATDELPTVDEIRQHLLGWRERLVAFRIRYQLSSPRSEAKSVRELLMTDTRNYIISEEEFSPGKPPRKVVNGGNELERFQAGYSSIDGGKSWKLSSLGKEDRQTLKLGSAKIFTPLYILLDSHSGQWMDEFYFTDNDVQVGGRELVDGESCIVLEVTYNYKGKVDGNGSRIWLAEDKDFLIKKITPNPGPRTGRCDSDFLCSEYRMHGNHWCPYRGQILLPPEDHAWEVLVFDDSPSYSAQLFNAPSTAGLVPRVLDIKDHSSSASVRSDGAKVESLPKARVPGAATGVFGAFFILAAGFGLFTVWRLRSSR